MGTEEGLAWLGAMLEKQSVTDAAFLQAHGWVQDGDLWVKGELRLPAYDTGVLGAVGREIDALMEADGWRQLCVKTTLPACKGQTEPDKLAYFQSPATGRIYQWLEAADLYYNQGMTEDDLYPARCSGKTVDLNKLFPGEKPDVIRVIFRLEEGYTVA